MARQRNIRQPITKSFIYRGFPLYQNRIKSADGFYTPILEKQITGLEELLSNHQRINVIRFDLLIKNKNGEYIQLENTNHLASKFFKILKRKLLSWKKNGVSRGIKRVFYQSVIECTFEKKTHHHCVLAYNAIARSEGARFADRDGNYISVYKLIVETWKEVTSLGCVNFGTKGYINHFYFIDRNAETFNTDIAECIKCLSYLAKVHSKQSAITLKNARIFNSSQSINRGKHDIKLTGPVKNLHDQDRTLVIP